MKICKNCQQEKDENTEFSTDKTRRNMKSFYCRKCDSKRRYEYSQKIRMKALCAYTNNNPKCECCGETTFEFLSIDHTDGSGSIHRKEIGQGSRIYFWLIKNNFPPGFRVLCMNCNHSLGMRGYCPHQRKTTNHS